MSTATSKHYKELCCDRDRIVKERPIPKTRHFDSSVFPKSYLRKSLPHSLHEIEDNSHSMNALKSVTFNNFDRIYTYRRTSFSFLHINLSI